MKSTVVALLVFFLLHNAPARAQVPPIVKTDTAKIQVAIILDVSNSMDGLIRQAKRQLWNMVKVIGQVYHNNDRPPVEIALYTYGHAYNDKTKGYIKKISGFTRNLDQINDNLSTLSTSGSYEYHGQAIFTALEELKWDSLPNSYKVIFIAGNEDFYQGPVHWKTACELATQKGVIVNTIYCGEREQGIREHWDLKRDCGDGMFVSIDHNARLQSIATPVDTTIISLKKQLSDTYIYYGKNGYKQFKEWDTLPKAGVGGNAKTMEYIIVKTDEHFYDNSSWDLIDASTKDSTILNKVDMKTLPPEWKNKSRQLLKQGVAQNKTKRQIIRTSIISANKRRDDYINTEKSKPSSDNIITLETAIEGIIREQVRRFGMRMN
ncbi:MAG TPA: hypothetical protein VHM26_04955 [Chitinophagaceae bacterium]|jgi:hypothetical protein|nr:hypothetical protein [Chitinophagaceae bacterium]